jgi:hypothetical protein
LVEHTLGKGEVSGSNPLKSSILQGGYLYIRLCFNGWVASAMAVIPVSKFVIVADSVGAGGTRRLSKAVVKRSSGLHNGRPDFVLGQ